MSGSFLDNDKRAERINKIVAHVHEINSQMSMAAKEFESEASHLYDALNQEQLALGKPSLEQQVDTALNQSQRDQLSAVQQQMALLGPGFVKWQTILAGIFVFGGATIHLSTSAYVSSLQSVAARATQAASAEVIPYIPFGVSPVDAAQVAAQNVAKAQKLATRIKIAGAVLAVVIEAAFLGWEIYQGFKLRDELRERQAKAIDARFQATMIHNAQALGIKYLRNHNDFLKQKSAIDSLVRAGHISEEIGNTHIKKLEAELLQAEPMPSLQNTWDSLNKLDSKNQYWTEEDTPFSTLHAKYKDDPLCDSSIMFNTSGAAVTHAPQA